MSIDRFFQRIEPCTSRKNFILDAERCDAYFVSQIDTSTFINIHSVCGVRLWHKKSGNSNNTCTNTLQHITDKKIPFPLLQSHLQKAVRLGLWKAALDTLTTMLHSSVEKTLRRIIIIMIEDVCLIQGSQFITWLLMAGSHYTLTNIDIHAIYTLVYTLCVTTQTFQDILQHSSIFSQKQLSHKYICSMHQQHDSTNTLLGLYYRTKYGGTKNDIQMLIRAIYIYGGIVGTCQSSLPILSLNGSKYTRNSINLQSETFIKTCIDFHCYPWILQYLSQQTQLKEHRIKYLVWCVDSCINGRKLETMKTRSNLVESEDWKTLMVPLKKVRERILKKVIKMTMDSE